MFLLCPREGALQIPQNTEKCKHKNLIDREVLKTQKVEVKNHGRRNQEQWN